MIEGVLKEITNLEKLNPKLNENLDNKLEKIKPLTESDEKFDRIIKIRDLEVDSEIKEIKTINSSLEGKEHPITNVPFEKKVVTSDSGEQVEGVFPKFESIFEFHLSPENYNSSDSKQFRECNNALKDEVNDKPEWASDVFDEEQLEQIKEGETPDGYTWHHNEELGKMELVDNDIHDKTAHTGGKHVWGGGSENR